MDKIEKTKREFATLVAAHYGDPNFKGDALEAMSQIAEMPTLRGFITDGEFDQATRSGDLRFVVAEIHKFPYKRTKRVEDALESLTEQFGDTPAFK